MKTTLLMFAVLLIAVPAFGQLDFDQNVTPDLIFGSGNANGFFTVDTQTIQNSDTIELGLRGKIRFDATGNPLNSFNSDGAGVYFFQAGVAFGQSFPTATWAFEWAVNTDVANTGVYKLDDFRYELGLDSDPSGAAAYTLVFDPFTPTVANPVPDHSMGDNTTLNGAGVEAANAIEYATNLSQYNVAQQSWRYSWMYPSTFDPTAIAVYDIYLKAYDKVSDVLVAHTHVQIVVDDGVANEPTSWGNVKSLFR